MTNFGRVIKDRKLATNDRQTKSGHWYADFGHFFVTNLSFSTSEVIAPTSDLHVGIPPATGHHVGGIDVPVYSMCKVNFLVDFARVITFSRAIPVFPLCQKCGPNILCH